jgi:hypothetical protein
MKLLVRIAVLALLLLSFDAAFAGGQAPHGRREDALQERGPAAAPRGRRLGFRRAALHALALAFLLLALATAVCCLFERRFIYFPSREPLAGWQPPGAASEECAFRAADGTRLHGWWHPGQGAGDPSPRPVLLWCHGNAGNITHREHNLRLVAARGLAALLFDYRGYGRSEGRPSEHGLYADAEGAYDYLVHERRVEPERIVCFGRSLGAAVALHLALTRPAAGLVMESPFRSAPAMARAKVPFLPVWLLMRTRFGNEARVRDLAVPLLVIHGDGDRLIPIEHGRALFEAAPEPKGFYVIEGAGHNDTYLAGGQSYFERLERFCRECVAAAGRAAP